MVNTIIYIALFTFMLNAVSAQNLIAGASATNPPVNQDKGMSVKEFMQKVNNPTKIVFVYFHADWCVPCLKLKPIIDQVEIDEKEKAVIMRMDVDKNTEISKYYEINSLPLFTIYKNGKSVWTHNSMLTLQEIETQIDSWSDKK